MKNVLEQFKMTDKVVVITGGAGLLGQKHAIAVAEAGGIPVILDINETRSVKVAEQIIRDFGAQSLGLSVDITKKFQIEEAHQKILDAFGVVDVLINNAANDPKMKGQDGKVDPSRFEKFDQQIWDQDLAVGLTGAYLCSQVFGEFMVKHGRGVILNIASDLGLIAPDQRIYQKEGVEDCLQPVKPVTYSVVKHGLIGLTKYLATYWAESGVRVNALCPSGVYQNQPDEFVKKLTQLIPMGRMAQEDEYKAAIIFLISEASSYMTGSVIAMDGGRTCW